MGDEARALVTWNGLFTLLGVVFVPVAILAAYAVQQAHEAHAVALEAKADAKSARPDPFTGSMAIQMERKLIERDAVIVAQCRDNVARVEKQVEQVEENCAARFHQAMSVYPKLRNTK